MNLKKYPMHKESPFIASMNLKTGNKAVGMGTANHMVDEDGVMSPVNIRMVIRKKVEKAKFIKLYSSDLLFKISPISLKLLVYLLIKSPYGSDRVRFDPIEWMDEKNRDKGLCHSSKTVYAALKELLDMQLLARSVEPSIYFTNPAVGFTGNRLDLFKDKK